MTDRERLIALLAEWGVPCELEGQQVIVEEGSSDKTDGYQGFYTLFQFTPDGEFVTMGAWE